MWLSRSAINLGCGLGGWCLPHWPIWHRKQPDWWRHLTPFNWLWDSIRDTFKWSWLLPLAEVVFQTRGGRGEGGIWYALQWSVSQLDTVLSSGKNLVTLFLVVVAFVCFLLMFLMNLMIPHRFTVWENTGGIAKPFKAHLKISTWKVAVWY